MDNRICLNLSALVHLDFEQQLRISAQAGFKAVGSREVNVLQYLSEGHSLEELGKLLDKYGLISLEYNFFPNWIYSQEKERPEIKGKFDYFCRTAAAMGSEPILIAPVSFNGKNDYFDYELAVKNLTELGKTAGSYRASVALEFLPWTRIDSIGKAWKIVEEADMENVGIVLDSFHYFEGSSTPEELKQVPVEKIFLCHLSDMNIFEGDLLTRTRELRVLPGEGSYPLDEIISLLESRGYSNYYSLEVLNRSYREKDPQDIADSAKRSMDKLMNKSLIR